MDLIPTDYLVVDGNAYYVQDGELYYAPGIDWDAAGIVDGQDPIRDALTALIAAVQTAAAEA